MSQLALDLIAKEAKEKTGYLELGKCGLTPNNPLLEQVWQELGKLNHLETLILSNEWQEWNEGEQLWETRYSQNKEGENRLADHPSTLRKLENLTTYICGGNWESQWQITKIPQFAFPEKIIYISLSGTQLTKIENLEKLPNLQVLNLSWNIVTKIENIDKLPNLQDLNLNCNEIGKIENLDQLPNLKVLDLSSNKLTKIENLDQLPNLEALDLSSNKLTKIENLDQLLNLEMLNLSWNIITKIENLNQLPNLEALDLSSNKLTKIENLDQLPNLQDLYLSSSQIIKIENLYKLPNLQEIDLAYNQIAKIETTIDLPNLQYLNLSFNQLTKIENLDKLPNLQDLNLRENRIAKIETTIELPTLLQLDLSNQRISILENLCKLPNLQILNLRENQIAKIETTIDLPNLQYLNLSFNQLTKIENLDKLPNLQRLNLESNHLTQINLGFLNQFPKIEDLDLRDNPIANIPPEVIEEYNYLENLLNYLQDLEEGGESNNEVKLLLIGNGNVGKTQVARRLAFQTNFIFDNQHHSTHSISLLQWKLPCPQLLQQGLQLNIWDFGVQDIYHATHRLFMRTRALFVLVWDKESETTPHHKWEGREYKNEQLLYWLSNAKYSNESSPVLVVQNKTDVSTAISDPYPPPVQEELKKQFPTIANFIRVSAKTGKGFLVLEDAISNLFTQNETRKNDLLLKKLPKTWLQVRTRIRQEQEKADGLKDMDYTTFKQWCKEAGIEQSAQSLVDFLHKTGVLYYQSNYFSGRIILDQAWAIDAVYKVLDRQGRYVELLEHYQGKIDYNTICKIWADNTDRERQLFLNFMLSSELCFETTLNKQWDTPLKERTFIVAQLLPEKEPDYIAKEQNRLQANLKYRLSYFLPSVFIQRFIIRAHLFSSHQYMWQQGIGIKYENNAFAVVRASNIPTYTINIHYNKAAEKGRLLKAILEEFEKLENEDKNLPQPAKGKSGLEVYKHYQSLIKDSIMSNISIRTLISQGKIKEALTRLPQTDSEIINLQSRFSRLEQQERMGTIRTDDAGLERNRLTNSLLNWLEENGYEDDQTSYIKQPPPELEKVETNQVSAKQKILFLAANPTDLSRVQTDKEYRIIKAELERGKHREQFEFLLPQLSLTIGELVRAMNSNPEIVHFSGHGNIAGIALVSDNNIAQLMPISALERLFKPVKNTTKLVILNACYSAEQAKVISALGIYVIGNNLPIGDDAAISFAKGLYIGLSEGKTLEKAFNDAMIVLTTENPNYGDVVEVWKDGNKLDW